MRDRQPAETGEIVRDGVRIAWEAYGSGPATILILPTWSVLDADHGRFQLIDLARRYRVITFDPRGNGRSDRPRGQAAYAGREFVADAVAVLDATKTEKAIVVACSLATHWLLQLAAEHPDRVLGAVASGTNLPLAPGHDRPEIGPFDEPYRSPDGWAKFNAAYWRDDYPGFLRFFFAQVWTEPHSERLIDVCVANGLGTTPQTLIDTVGANPMTEDEAIALVRRTRCPWLVIHGEGDELQPHARAERLAEVSGGSLVTFAERATAQATAIRCASTCSFVSSPRSCSAGARGDPSGRERGAGRVVSSWCREPARRSSGIGASRTSCASADPISRSSGWSEPRSQRS